jgi:hypothetical protein
MRALVMGRINDAWSEGTHEEKYEKFWPAFVALHKRWKDLGAKLLGTIDDSYLMVGQPTTHNFTFYELYEVPDVEMIRKMLDIVRRSDVEDVNLYRYLRFEVIIGPPVSEEAERFWNE